MSDHDCVLPESGEFLALYKCGCGKLWTWAGFWAEVGS